MEKTENFIKIGIFVCVAYLAVVFSQKDVPVDNTNTYATPHEIVVKILKHLGPKEHETFLDVGSGDGRVVIEAARRFGCKAIGIEKNPERVKLAIANAKKAGVSDKVSFIVGDFTKVTWPEFDVAYVFLFPDDLAQIRDKLTRADRFASHAHAVPGLKMTQYKECYSWPPKKIERPVKKERPFVWYNGRKYYSVPDPNCYCRMCNYIRAGLRKQGVY